MQPEPNHKLKVDDDRDDWGVLVLLVCDHDQRPWSVDEIIRESNGDKVAVLDALDRLRKAGLVHQTRDSLVFPTRAALHYSQIRT